MKAKQLHKEFKNDIKRFEKEFKTDIKIYQVRIYHEYSYHEKCQRYWIYGYGLGDSKINGGREYCHFDMIANVSTLCAESAVALYNKVRMKFINQYVVCSDDNYVQCSVDLSALDEITAYKDVGDSYQLAGKMNCAYDINNYSELSYIEDGFEIDLNCTVYSPMAEIDVGAFASKYGSDVRWVE